MFEHSVKVPRLYKICSKILEEVCNKKTSVKAAVYQVKHPNLKAIYSLVSQTLKHMSDLDTLFEQVKLFDKEPQFSPWLARILVTEMIWTKGRLQGHCRPVVTILKYEKKLRHLSLSLPATSEANAEGSTKKPRYVRVNTLKMSTFEAVNYFRNEGWKFCRLSDDETYESFLILISTLQPNQFTTDIHVKDLLVFPHKTEFFTHELYTDGSIFLQDKATCLAPMLLNPPEESTILDMCAAPGIKTCQLASLINDKGTIVAVEMDEKRFKTLNEFIEISGAKCIKTIQSDSTKLSEYDCNNTEYILVDPSCSNSGLYEENQNNDEKRIGKLSKFQQTLLIHAMTAFPQVKRIVYSTCSLSEMENENVVARALTACPHFTLVDVRQIMGKKWQHYGSEEYADVGAKCLYARPDLDQTIGFFVAVLEPKYKNTDKEGKKSNKRKLEKSPDDADEQVKMLRNTAVKDVLNSI